MVLVAILLLVTGLMVGLLGQKLFRVLLPVLGLVGGMAVGFAGFQAVFGTGTLSTTMAVFTALVVGVVLALLSFVFFELALTIAVALLGASVFSYLGIALGLSEQGFVLFLLSLAGFILGLAISSSASFGASFVISATSLAGSALVLASVFLIAGDVSLQQLHEGGIIRSALGVIDQSFLWLFVWLAGSIVAMQVQKRLLLEEILENKYQFRQSS